MKPPKNFCGPFHSQLLRPVAAVLAQLLRPVHRRSLLMRRVDRLISSQSQPLRTVDRPVDR